MITKDVENILSASQTARDSDKELIIMVLQRQGAQLDQNQINILRGISFESIRRYRQKLQEQGKYPPSPNVARQRKLKSYIVQQNIPKASPEYTEKIVSHQPQPLPW